MALADYDIAVEKIAALKAAVLDPSLVNLATVDFTANDDIYIFIGYYFQINQHGFVPNAGYRNVLDTFKAVKNDTIKLDPGYVILYIKDSDIIYSDPITTYQNRLSIAYTNNLSMISNTESFTSPVNGSILTYTYSSNKINGKYFGDNGLIGKFAIPPGVTITTAASTSQACAYFNVPVDW